ncbi:MAG TPA: phage major capsid protein [Rubrivivax sp.]|nr:phage major capsid protein [Rubrivivax sp.]
MSSLRTPPDPVGRFNVEPLTLSPKELAGYSIARALESAANGDWFTAGFEREVNEESHRRAGTQPRDIHSFIVPSQILAQRDLTVASPSGGGYLTDSPALGVVDALRPASVVFKAGAQSLTGLRPNATYARQGGTSTVTWQPTESTQAAETASYNLASIAVQARTVGAYVEQSWLSRRMAPDLTEAMVRRDLRLTLATALDIAALDGSGSGEPLGLLNTVGIGTFTGTSVDYADLLEVQADILAANALTDGGALSFVTAPAVAQLLAARQGFSADRPLWAGPLAAGLLVACPARSSMNVPADTLLCGDFSQLMIAEFGVGIELRVNPFASFQAGIIGYGAFLSMDVAVLQPLAFSVGTGVS